MAPQRDVDKRAFLQELQDIRDLHVGPWLVAGDFNLIMDPEDKSRGCLHRSMMARFRRSLSVLELKELSQWTALHLVQRERASYLGETG
jgi:endonuclease/exonuclease/phosphatase (EEP) superfamily protein YafD